MMNKSINLPLVVFLAIHLLYLCMAILLYRRARRTASRSVKRRLFETCITAALFSPGLYWYFMFPVPTFVLLTPVWHILQFIAEGGRWVVPIKKWIVPQLAVTVIPFLLTWAALFAFGSGEVNWWSSLKERKKHKT